MIYVECKIWPFSDDVRHQKVCYKIMKEGHKHYTVKVLINITSSINFISKSLVDKLGEKYSNHYKNKRVKNLLGTIRCLNLSF